MNGTAMTMPLTSPGFQLNVAASPRFHVARNFFAGATRMRSSFERHFETPYTQTPRTHNLWNYWHVPELYTYLRAQPESILNAGELDHFWRILSAWSAKTLGMGNVSRPQLSLYVNGCGQSLHNDAANGRWGYVFSLTRWNERSFRGGET